MNVKKITAVILSICMILTVIPSFVFRVDASDATTSNKEAVVNETTNVRYEWFDDISTYRTKNGDYYENCPQKEGYVFGGWFSDSTDTSAAIGKDVTEGSAWAKFVPEDTLSIKAQINTSLQGKDLTNTELDKVNLRLCTAVDSLKYNSVWFDVTAGDGETKSYSMQEVYASIKVKEDESNLKDKLVNPSSVFGKAASRFATLRITGIPNTSQEFIKLDISVTPYWITKDGSKAIGITRSNFLISDELANYADKDGELNATGISDKAAYEYYKNASDTVYLSGTYTTAGSGNHFGITIRNGGQTRQVYYDGMGVKVYRNEDIETATATYNTITNNGGAFVWSQTGDGSYPPAMSGPVDVWPNENTSAVTTMLKSAIGTTHKVVWAIEHNYLYGSVDGYVFLRIPMTALCSEWVDGRYYQLGVATYNSEITTGMTFEKTSLAFGKEAYGTSEETLLVKEDAELKENLTITNMAYEPITGSYMPATQSGAKYAYGKAVKFGTPVAIEADINWQKQLISGGCAGISVKIGEVTEQLFISPMGNDTNDYEIKNLNKHSYQGPKITNNVGTTNITSKGVVAPAFDSNGVCNIKVAVYDSRVSVLFNGVTAYEVTLASLFDGNAYSENDNISLGIATWDSCYGQSHFRNVKFYEGQDAIDEKLESWTYYPTTTTKLESYNVKTGYIDSLDTNYSGVYLGESSDVWQITGTMSHAVNTANGNPRSQGFGMQTDSGQILRILGQSKGFCYSKGKTVGWENQTYTYNNGSNKRAFQAVDGFFNTAKGSEATPITFQAVVAHDTFYMWINGKLTWLVPIRELNTDIAEGSSYILNTADWDTDSKFENLIVRKGSEVDSTLIKTLKAANHMDWLEANAYKTLSTDGKVTTLNTTSIYTSHVVSSSASDSVWLSGTWEIAALNSSNAVNLFGITISDGTNSRQIGFQSQGIAVSQEYKFTVTSELNNIYYYNTANQSTGRTNGIIWAVKKTSDATNSPIVDMRTSIVGSEHQLIWAIQDNTLYGSVNGVTCIILPLEKICSSWTADANKQYYIGLENWAPKNNGDVSVSNVELLFGDDAEAKINVNTLSDVDTRTMFYDVIEGAYMPQFTSGFAGLYGATVSTTAGVQADIEWVDMTNAASGAGISVKTETGSMQVYVEGTNKAIRVQKNHGWTNPVIAIKDQIANSAVPFDSDGKSQVKALVANDTLYIYYNDVLGYELKLADYIDEYVVGSDVQVGIATWDANLGLSLFKNVKFLSADEVNTMMPRVSLGDASTTWEVNGTMTQEDLTTLVSQGFEITASDKTLALLGKDYGFTANGTEYGYVAEGTRYVKIDNEDYYNFFRADGSRTNTEINFRLRLVENKLNVWFDDVLVWDIPLTDAQFGEFASDAAYEISLFAENAVAFNVFRDWTVLQGTDVKALVPIDETSSTTATFNEMTGTVTRTGDNFETVLLDGTSKTWEVTGTMKTDSSNKWIPQGFAVKDASSGKVARYYGSGNGIQVYSPWKKYTDSRYALNADTANFFTATRTVDEVQFRLVLEEDVLFLWLDEVLSWRIPLTATQFGGFESGSIYQIGLTVNGNTPNDANDDGIFTYDNVVARCSGEADTTGATKYTWTEKSAGVTVDAENAKASFRAAAATEYIYFGQDDAETDAKYSNKWEITGTITRDDMNTGSVIGFMVEDENGNQAGYNFWSGNAVGVGKAWNWTSRKVSDYPDNVYLNIESEEFAGRLNDRSSIDYRVVILDDVLYAYFNEQLTWKLPLTDAIFGYTKVAGKTPELAAFTAGSNYRLGIKRVDKTPITVSNIRVKTGKAVLTESDFFMRDPYILANEAGDMYYMYGTRYSGSFDVFSSSDLMVWTKEGQCFVAEDDFWGKKYEETASTTYWAPEVHEYNGEYYMFATFRGTYNGKNVERGTAILKSESGTPVGPFVEYSDGPVTPVNWKCLDGTLYVEDGTPYMVYCREYTDSGILWPNVGKIYYQQLSADLKTTVGNPVLILDATDAYDYNFTPSVADEVADGYVTDGPQLYKTDGQLFLLWSTFVDGTGNTANNRYLQLQVRSDDGTIAGLKDGKYVSDLPILYGSSEDEDGGHGMIFTDFNGNARLSLFTPNKYLKTDSNKSHMQLFDITYNKDGKYLEAK